MASQASQTFTASQVCQIVTGENGDLDYMFPGSDDDLDMHDLDEVERKADSENETNAEKEQLQSSNAAHKICKSYEIL